MSAKKNEQNESVYGEDVYLDGADKPAEETEPFTGAEYTEGEKAFDDKALDRAIDSVLERFTESA